MIKGKSAAQDTTLTLYLLGRAQNLLAEDYSNDYGVVHSSSFVKHVFQYIIFIKLIYR